MGLSFQSYLTDLMSSSLFGLKESTGWRFPVMLLAALLTVPVIMELRPSKLLIGFHGALVEWLQFRYSTMKLQAESKIVLAAGLACSGKLNPLFIWFVFSFLFKIPPQNKVFYSIYRMWTHLLIWGFVCCTKAYFSTYVDSFDGIVTMQLRTRKYFDLFWSTKIPKKN